jgi:hypothetical protein
MLPVFNHYWEQNDHLIEEASGIEITRDWVKEERRV